MNEKIIAGIVSITGIVVNMYLTAKQNKEAIKKIKLEFSLERQKKASDEFKEFISKIAQFKYSLNSILFNLSHSETTINWQKAGEEINNTYRDLISSWHKIQYDVRDFEMKKAKKLECLCTIESQQSLKLLSG